MNPQDLINIGDKAREAHEAAKIVLERGQMGDMESQRDECEEKKNAVMTVINWYEDQLAEQRSLKRAIDDRMDDLKKGQREFENLKNDLTTDAKRLNNTFWDLKRSAGNLSQKPD